MVLGGVLEEVVPAGGLKLDIPFSARLRRLGDRACRRHDGV